MDSAAFTRDGPSLPRIGVWADMVAYLLPLALATVFLISYRGVDHYAPPSFGGSEPAETQRGAIQILRTGTTDMTFHVTGYAYFCALVYLFLPNVPLSVLVVQIAMLPVVVWCVGRVAAELGGPSLGRWGRLVAGAYYPFAYYALAFSSIYPAFVFLTLMVVWALPLHRGARSWARAAAVGAALGAVVCHRPNFALVGPFLVGSLWSATRSLREAVLRSFPVAAISLGMLAGMTAANPPDPGDLLRGSKGFGSSFLQGSFQYAYRWWDWEWIEDASDRGTSEYYALVKRLEQEAGERYPHPAVNLLMRREAWKRVVGQPLNSLKKAAISSVRLWIFIPTHLSSMTPKVMIAAQEFVVLCLAAGGLFYCARRAAFRFLLVGVLLAPILTHLLVTVEARYSLPARGAELALAVCGGFYFWGTLRHWLHNHCTEAGLMFTRRGRNTSRGLRRFEPAQTVRSAPVGEEQPG